MAAVVCQTHGDITLYGIIDFFSGGIEPLCRLPPRCCSLQVRTHPSHPWPWEGEHKGGACFYN